MKTLELFEKLVTIPSPFPNEAAISRYLASYLKKLGFSVKLVPTEKTRNNIIATYGKAKKYIGFYGHMDTVPPEKEVKNPYKIIMKGKQAWGLGTEDMKGGIAAILQTGEYAVAHNYPIKIVFGVDEENISKGAHDLVSSGLLDDVDFLVAAESGQVKDLTKPFSAVFGRKGRILFELTVIGKKAHAAESKKGSNAIEKMAELICLIKKIPLPKHALLGETDIVFHTLLCETDSFSIPDKAVVHVSLLTNPKTKSDDFIKKVKALAKKQKIQIEIAPVKRDTPYGESYEIPLNNIFVKKLKEHVLKSNNVVPIYTPSVADENVFANRLRIPVLALGPIGNGGHTKNEWVNIESVLFVEKIYKQILTLFVKI